MQFSLRTFFLMLTALAVWLGFVANQTHEQRAAIQAIEATGGAVVYEWQRRGARKPPVPGPFSIPVYPGEPDGPAWLRRIIGDDYFQKVEIVVLSVRPPYTEAEILEMIPHLQRLRGRQEICFDTPISAATFERLKAALPHCKLWPPLGGD